MTIEIPLTQGKVALIDKIDADRVLPLKWSVHQSRGDRLYARHAWVDGGKWHHVKMHRFILRLGPNDPVVDHKNGNGLDNRRANLRTATHSQNLVNRGTNGRLGLKGVIAVRGRYLATLRRRHERFYLGTYDSPEQAARMYDAATHIVDGEFAWTNFPDIDPECLERVERILNGDKSALPKRPRAKQKLTDDDVVAARRRYIAGGVLIRELAEELGVTPGCISHALSGYTFGHIQNPPPIVKDKRRSEVSA